MKITLDLTFDEILALKNLVQNALTEDEDAVCRSIREKVWNALPSLSDLEVLTRYDEPELDSDL